MFISYISEAHLIGKAKKTFFFQEMIDNRQVFF